MEEPVWHELFQFPGNLQKSVDLLPLGGVPLLVSVEDITSGHLLSEVLPQRHCNITFNHKDVQLWCFYYYVRSSIFICIRKSLGGYKAVIELGFVLLLVRKKQTLSDRTWHPSRQAEVRSLTNVIRYLKKFPALFAFHFKYFFFLRWQETGWQHRKVLLFLWTYPGATTVPDFSTDCTWQVSGPTFHYHCSLRMITSIVSTFHYAT